MLYSAALNLGPDRTWNEFKYSIFLQEKQGQKLRNFQILEAVASN